jgi:predicted transcriptional regulator
MDYIKVSGHDGLVRDQNTGAILNLDDSAIEDINMLKNEVSEIKTLLRELIKHASNSSS